MKFLPLIWAGIWRKPVRAALIVLQIVLAFALFGVLQGVNIGVTQAISRTHADRLFVGSRITMGEPLPIAMLSQLGELPGVAAVAYRARFQGTYQLPNQFIQGLATHVPRFFAMFPELKVSAAEVDRLHRTPDGAIVGWALAREYGWRIGDHIPIQSLVLKQDGTRNWSFDIVGIYSQPDRPEQATLLVVNYSYVNAIRQLDRDTTNMFMVRIEDPARSAVTALAIDNLFANSPYATRTQSESEYAQAQMQRLGDLNFVANIVTSAAFLSLLIATAALMMQSIRERTPELAVLKTMGYPDALIVRMVMAEVLLLWLVGCGAGLASAQILLPFAREMIGLATISSQVIAVAFACAALLAVLSGLTPALRALRLKIVDALERR